METYGIMTTGFFTPMLTSAFRDIFVCDFVHCSTRQETVFAQINRFFFYGELVYSSKWHVIQLFPLFRIIHLKCQSKLPS